MTENSHSGTTGNRKNELKFGLALGGGSARGLAHIPMLEVLDDLGIKPSVIVGCSFGAIVGAAYAAGMTGKAIREHAESLLSNRIDLAKHIFGRRGTGPGSLLSLRSLPSMQLNGERLADIVLPENLPANIEDLAIPFKVSTTDYENMREHVLTHGPLRTAVGASIAIPGLIAGPHIEGRLHVDGGVTNPVPFDHARMGCDIVVAIDVTGKPDLQQGKHPSSISVAVGSLLILFNKVAELNRTINPPDVYVKPDLAGIGAADFFRAKDIFSAMAPEQAKFREQLEIILNDNV
jgi:NTE family protein